MGIIGCCLRDSDNLIDLLAVPTEHFSTSENREIVEVLKQLAQEDREPDFAVIQSELHKRYGRKVSFSDLALLGNAGVGTDFWSRVELLAEDHLRRRISRACNSIMQDLGEPAMTGEEIASKGIEALSSLSAPVETTVADIWGVLNTLCSEGAAGVRVEHFQTGLGRLDAMLGGGLPRQTLTVIGARTSMGKSALAAQIGMNVAKQGKTVLYFSVEMPAKTMARRVMAAACGIEPAAIRLGLPKERWEVAQKDLRDRYAGVKFFVNDDSNMTSAKAAGVSRRMKRQHGLDLIVIDYLQRLNDLPLPGESQNQLMGRLSRSFQNLARQLDCAVILVSQLNRAPEARQDNRPKAADLRDSGSIEQDADNVLLIHRPNRDKPGADQSEAFIIIDKARDGVCGRVKAFWDSRGVRFLSVDERRGSNETQS